MGARAIGAEAAVHLAQGRDVLDRHVVRQAVDHDADEVPTTVGKPEGSNSQATQIINQASDPAAGEPQASGDRDKVRR